MAGTTSLHLRLPNSLYKRLQRQARRNNVSLNTEIVNQLEGHEEETAKRLRPWIDQAVRTAVTESLLSEEALLEDPEVRSLTARLSELDAKMSNLPGAPSTEFSVHMMSHQAGAPSTELTALLEERRMIKLELKLKLRDRIVREAGATYGSVRVIPLGNPVPASPPVKAKEPASEPEKK